MLHADASLRLDAAYDPARDHVLGPPGAEITLLEYGSYASPRCHAVHPVVEELRNRFGDRMRYVFRHVPVPDDPQAVPAAELAEYAAARTGRFWEMHETLMTRGPQFSDADLADIAREAGLPENTVDDPAFATAQARVREDSASAARHNVRVTPTFFINGQRYRGTWDASSLADAMLGSLGYRVQKAAFDFVRWGPASGLLLALATVLALILSNSPAHDAFAAIWTSILGVQWRASAFALSLLDWVNHGLLTVFFIVVGLEIKREFTVGHLSSLRSGALPVLAAMGGIALPALIFMLMAPPGMRHGWGIPIGTDTAFAVAIIVLLGARVPVELRVFLTAAVIMDDIVAILVIALFYTGTIHPSLLMAAAGVTLMLLALNRARVHQLFPYAVLAIVLWALLHEAGLHATLAGVILAMLVPTRPPANLNALMAQASAVIQLEGRRAGEAMRTGPSEPALHALDQIHDHLESPADRMLRVVEPWSSYVVLPLFALANAGVALSLGVFAGHTRLMLAIFLGLVVGKPVGIIVAARISTALGLAEKPDAYSWRQLWGAGVLAGIGFTMSLFIASAAYPESSDYSAAKVAIFLASITAATFGAVLLWRSSTDRAETAG